MGRKVFRRGVTTTSTTLADVGEIGDVRLVDGVSYRLVYTSASLASSGAGLILTLEDQATFEVKAIAVAETQPVYAVNSTGGSVAALSYLWAMTHGPFAITSAMTSNSTIAANQAIAGMAGEVLITWTSAATVPPCGQNGSLSIASNASGTVTIRGAGA